MNVFQRPEHEMLRQMARANPDWAVMQQLAVTAMDWGYLRGTALLHQLDGVAAWRCLDDRLDGFCPQIVRADCVGYLQHLSAVMQAYLADCAALFDWLRGQGLRFVVAGGPPQYHTLGIPWPARHWREMGVTFALGSQDELAFIAEHLRPVAVERTKPLGGWHMTLASGTAFSFSVELDHEQAWAGQTWDLFDCAPVTYLGVEWPMVVPEVRMLESAYGTWWQVNDALTRLSLWGLARLAALAVLPGFSWEKVGAMLRRDIEERRAAGNFLWNVARTPGGQITYTHDLTETNCPAQLSLWTLAKADEAYGFLLAGGVAGLVAPHEVRRPLAMSQGRVRGAVPKRGEECGRYALYEWVHEPAIEDLVFGYQEREGLDPRFADGLWKLVAVEDADVPEDAGGLPPLTAETARAAVRR